MVRRTRQRGFVLATSVWMIAIILLLGSLFHGYVQSQFTRAVMVRSQLQQSIDADSTEQTLLYLLATRRVTRAGLTVLPQEQGVTFDEDLGALTTSTGSSTSAPTGSEIRLDGSVHKGIGCIRFSLQDRGGFIGLNNLDALDWYIQLMKRHASSPQVRSLVAALADYTDGNNRRRIGGAERAEYHEAGLGGPRNAPLRSDAELFAVYGWEQWLKNKQHAHWREWVDINRSNRYNVNTAPVGLLPLLLDIGVDEASQLQRIRSVTPFRSLDDVAEALSRLNVWQPERFRFYPTEKIRLELWCEGDNYSTVRAIQLTPKGLLGPWLTDYRYRRNHDSIQTTAEQVYQVAGGLFTDTVSVDQR
jgi:general secretion pathway protein K